MKIKKFINFITENIHDTPESYISTALKMIKGKIEKMFDDEIEEDEMSFSDLNVTLESIELSKYSKLYDSLTVKFSDPDFAYTMIIIIDIKEAVVDDTKDFELDDIKNCYIKFKKYDLDNFDLLGQIDKNTKIKDIDQNFIINLKLEIDETFGIEGDDNLEIETK
jgi:hypothetical protein